MAQVTTGIRAILSSPKVYDMFQNGVGAKNARRQLAGYMNAAPGSSVLDIGCGTADLAEFLPGVRYVGFDVSERYIEAARQRFGDKYEVFAAGIDDVDAARFGTFDVVVAQGVLHHIDDEQCLKLFKLGASVLNPGGRLVTADPCLVEGQAKIAHALISRDRGQNVRDERGYRALAETSFGTVESHIRHDLLRIPYTHAILVCST